MSSPYDEKCSGGGHNLLLGTFFPSTFFDFTLVSITSRVQIVVKTNKLYNKY